MEVQLQQGSPTADSKETFRSVKPPDQCVISYNFEHANTLNFTHNMLIGIGLQEPSRKNNNSLSNTNKQKLFSIIPQPKKVFRNQASSLSKAYSAAVLPKRYVPSSPKPRINPNYSQYASSEQREKTNNQKSSYTQQDRSFLAVTAERDLIQLVDLNSPYSTLAKRKTEKSNLSKNQKQQMVVKSHTTQKAAVFSKVQTPAYGNKLSEEEEAQFGYLNGNVFDEKQIKEVSEDKESQSNLQENALSNNVDEKQLKQPNQTHDVTYLSGSFMKNKPNSTLSIKPQHSSKQQLPQSNASIQAQKTMPKGASLNDSNIEGKIQALNSQQIYQKGQRQTRRLHKNRKKSQQQINVKSKKQIQDEQLQELQSKIRRQEAGKFKKGYFRVSSNNKEKQILPFQASIEPIFPSNKQSFSQLPHNSSLPKNNSTSSISNNHNINHSKTDPRKTFDQLPRTNSGFNTISNFNSANYNHNSKIKGVNSQNLNKTSQKDSIMKPNKLNSSSDNITQIKENQNMKKNPSIKKQTNNLTEVAANQKIKRTTEDNMNMAKVCKSETTENVKTTNKEPIQDLTANNQIKGFKVPQKAFLSKAAIMSQFKNHQSSKSTQQIKRNQNGNKQKIGSHSVLKPTISRQSKDKDYKFKKWREAEIKQVEKHPRESKQREQSNTSRERQRQSKRSQSKKMKQKPNKKIDLDAQQEDRFGLLSLRKAKSNRPSKNKPKNKKIKENKQFNNNEIDLNEEQELQNLQESQIQSNHSYQEANQENLKLNDSESEDITKKLQRKKIKKQDKTEGKQQKLMEEDLIDENLERISSIHSSRITEQDEEATEQQSSQQNRQSLQPRKNLQQLLKATQESPSPNKHQSLPVYIQLENFNIVDPVTNKNAEEIVINEQNKNKQAILAKQIDQNLNKAMIESSIQDLENNNKPKQSSLQNKPILFDINPVSNEAQQMNEKIEKIQKKTSNIVRMGSPQANTSNKQQDFFDYNIKQMSKFNETVNQTFNITKYESFDRDLLQYTRAPILSFIYGYSQKVIQAKNAFIPSLQRTSLLDQSGLGQTAGEEVIDQAINILLSIDHWIIQRIFEPFLNINQEIGVWLHWYGQWQVLQVKGDNYRAVLQNAITKIILEKGIECNLEIVLRLISGVRVAKLKSSKKRVLSQLDYSLNKKHVLKAVTSKDSKWGERMFEVVKVETSKQGGNVLKLKQRSQYFWVKQQKFQQIFQHFLLICIRPSHFWTTTPIASKESHKSVISLSSEAPVHGSVTLYYPSQQKSSLSFYKQLQSKVLKYMGKIEQKANQNGNLYFQFRMHGTYYLFLETPADCELAIQSTSKLTIGQPEYIASQTLKNDKCEYVEIEHARNSNRPAIKQMETLEKLREKFINMVSIK